MLNPYNGIMETNNQRGSNRATSLKPRASRDSNRISRPMGMRGGGARDMFEDVMGMHNNAMKEFDNFHKNMFDFGFGSKIKFNF